MTNIKIHSITWTRVNNDINGNPRYVCHFLNLLSEAENDKINRIENKYARALTNAYLLGGRKYRAKHYGGGIVFQSYNLHELTESILLTTSQAVRAHRKPTEYEIRQGYGATHYRVFLKEDITNKNGEIKKRFKADDGLFYSTY